MKPHVVIAVDAFTRDHIARIEQALGEWATFARIAEAAPPVVYQSALQSAEIFMGWPDPQALLASPVKFLQLPSVGYDGYTGKGLESKAPFIMANAAGVMNIQMAEHVLGMMFALTRRISEHVRDQQAKRWQHRHPYQEVYGTVMCVVGLGDIGTEMARRGLALGMQVIGVRRDAGKKHSLVEQVYPMAQLQEAVAQADHVVSILPGGAQTARLYDEAMFARFKSGSYFYNIGRGSSVVEDALIVALKSGHLAGAGLDVFANEPLLEDSPLWDMHNVIITPHVGGRSAKEYDRMCDLFIHNLTAYRDGGTQRNIILSQ